MVAQNGTREKSDADVIIVGAGVIGAATAYYLSRRGADVLVLERNHAAWGASGATAGLIGASASTGEPLRRLMFESFTAIKEASSDFDHEPELQPGGSILTSYTTKGARHLQILTDRDRSLGIASDYVDGDEARRLEPLLAPEVVAAQIRPNDYHLNPLLLCQGYLRAAKRRGAMIRYGVSVRNVVTSGDRIERVITDDGDLHARWVINACGAHAPEIMARTGLEVPIVPARGQVMISERCPPLTPYILNAPDHLYLRQTASGNFFMGSHTEYVGFDKRITLEKISTYARGLTRLVPFLARLRVIRFHSGWRPMTPDNLPIIGPVPSCSRLILAAGHCRSGVLYSAVTGKLVSELVADGTTHLPIEPFAIDRFSQDHG